MAHAPLTPDSLVLTLASDDSWLHVGTVDEVIHHAASHRGAGHAPDGEPRAVTRALDFFDPAGYRLVPLVDETLEVHGFAPVGGRAAPVTVRRRIDRVLARADAYLAEHPATQLTHYPVGTTTPKVSGTLAEVVETLHKAEIRRDNDHKRGWFHNLLHAMG